MVDLVEWQKTVDASLAELAEGECDIVLPEISPPKEIVSIAHDLIKAKADAITNKNVSIGPYGTGRGYKRQPSKNTRAIKRPRAKKYSKKPAAIENKS